MTFVDTSAIYALLDRADEHHEKAAATWVGLLNDEESLITTNYVVIECCALAQRRLGLKAARSIQDDILPIIAMHWIDKAIHGLAMAAWLAAGRAKLSLVDCLELRRDAPVRRKGRFRIRPPFHRRRFPLAKPGLTSLPYTGK